jgi:hypothetical protein
VRLERRPGVGDKAPGRFLGGRKGEKGKGEKGRRLKAGGAGRRWGGKDAEGGRREAAGNRGGGGDKAQDLRRISEGGRQDADQRGEAGGETPPRRREGRSGEWKNSRGPAGKGVANPFPEAQEPDGFLEAAEGDVKGVEVFGLAEEAVQTGLEEVHLVQEGGLAGLMGFVGGGLQGPEEMLEVAGEGRGGQAEIGGQDATGLAGHEPAVDLG